MDDLIHSNDSYSALILQMIMAILPTFAAMSTAVYRDAPCTGTKNTSERAFVHTQNDHFGSIFVPERCCAASVVNRHISDGLS